MWSLRLIAKAAAIAALSVVVAAAGVYAAYYRPDIPFATLEERYGGVQSQYADLGDSVRLHYRDEGPRDAPTIVMIHGFASSLQTWDQWSSSLNADYRVIRIDLPGHGLTRAPRDYAPSYESYAGVVEQLMRRLNIEHAIVAGSSLGGGVAWTLALRHPDRVQGLVLVGAAGWPEMPTAESPLSPTMFRVLGEPVIGDLARGLDATGAMKAMLLGCYADPARVDDALVARYVDMSRAPDHRPVLTTVLLTFGAPATNETMARIQAPTLVLHGADDALVPVRAAARFDAGIPQSEAIVYPGAGHFVHEERAGQTVDDLRAWFHREFPAQ